MGTMVPPLLMCSPSVSSVRGSREAHVRNRLYYPSLFASLLCLLITLTQARAHGPRPKVVNLTVSNGPTGAIHALTSNQGVFADLNASYRWVCEDAIYPLAFTQGLALFGEFDSRWVVATNHGIHVSEDAGCDFEPVIGELGRIRTAGLWRHPLHDTLFSGSVRPDGPNRLYRSTDQGATWIPVVEDLEGHVLSILWLSSGMTRMIIHTGRRLYLADAQGDDLSPLNISLDNVDVPAHLIRTVAVAGGDIERILVTVDGGARQRLLLSDDLGRSWNSVFTFDTDGVSLVFDPSGEEVFAVDPSGRRWRGTEGAQQWVELEPGPRTMGCLRLGPAGELLACGDPNSDGEWVIGRSFDFGLTWESVLERFEDTVHRKDCPDSAPTVQCCRGRCPGDAEMCGQPLNPGWPPECYETEMLDGGQPGEGTETPDLGMDISSDGGPVEGADAALSDTDDTDDDRSSDAMLPRSQGGRSNPSGCMHSMHVPSGPGPLAPLVVLVGLFGLRHRRA